MVSNLPQREEYLRKKRRRRLVKYCIILLVVFSIIGLISYASHRPQIRINKIELSGGVLVTQDDVDSTVRPLISGSYFLLFPKNNAFIYPKSFLEQYLKQKFQRIDTINIYLKGFKTMVVEITERKPVATWCDTPPTNNAVGVINPNEHCYFMDSDSTIFAPAPQFSGDAYFKYYGIISTDSPIGKEYIASTTEFSDISDFIASTKSLNLGPQYLLAEEDGQFNLIINGGGEIMFDTREPMTLAASNLVVLLRTPALATSSGVLPVDYIDLRYGNKLFYKLK